MTNISEDFLQKIYKQAMQEFPRECCGVILGHPGEKNYTRVKELRNVQDEYHAKDPITFPRTSSQAYFMAPEDLLALHKEMRQNSEEIRVIYHSHIDAPGNFSSEDLRLAIWKDQPVYPEAEYLVISLGKKGIASACLYCWDPQALTFILAEKMKLSACSPDQGNGL